MGRKGKRYETEGTLNYKKVFAAILAILVVVMFFLALNKILNNDQNKTANKTYFALYAEEKWGIIDEKGVKIIEPSYQEMIIVPDSSKDVFLCVYDVNYSESTYKTKALNSKNEEIFTGYERIEALENIDEDISFFYTNLTLDGRFVNVGENKWNLRERVTFDKVHIDMNEIYVEEEEEEVSDEDVKEEYVSDDYDDYNDNGSDSDDDISQYRNQKVTDDEDE